MKKKTEVKFLIVVQNKLIDELSNVMSKCDLGVDEVQYHEAYIYTLTTTSVVDNKYIIKIKKALKDGLDIAGYRLISIKKI